MDHPLCDAAFRGDVTRLNRLLEQPEIQTELNDELVEQCFINAITEGHLDISKALISLPPAVFDFTQVSTPEGSAFYLIMAAIFEQLEIFKFIAETGKVDLTRRDDKGATPLHWACKQGALPIIEYLVQQEGVNPDEQDKIGQTPLTYAAKEGRDDVVRRLLQVDGVDPDAQDHKGKTPFYWASFYHHSPLMKILGDSGRVNRDIEAQTWKDGVVDQLINSPWLLYASD